MKSPTKLCITTMGIVVASGLLHINLQSKLTNTEAQSDAANREVGAVERNREATEIELATILSKTPSVQTRSKSASAPAITPAAIREGPSNRTKAVTANPQLRELLIQAYVEERLMIHEALFQKLGLSPDQVRSFEQIEREYRRRILEMETSGESKATNANIRMQLADARDSSFRELFGDLYPQWEKASTTEGALSNVRQLLQQSFQTGGPINALQSEKLVEIVASHRIAGSQGKYDWPAIRRETSNILSGAQLEAFNSATSVKEISERMAELSTRR